MSFSTSVRLLDEISKKEVLKMEKKEILKEEKIKKSCKHYTNRYCSYQGSCKKCIYNPLSKKRGILKWSIICFLSRNAH